jgi:hypothetical protein
LAMFSGDAPCLVAGKQMRRRLLATADEVIE